ncbi:MAG: hypothetical protein QNJ41_07955 [Xenococcaceae cyanobacterium MO_188.B32]|nr:hypothetical protein [Xenococcaceae cyanobacterium MO_188.B32]
MRFTTDEEIKNEIKKSICQYLEGKNSGHFDAILVISGLNEYKNKITINQPLYKFTENFYALLIEDFERKL